MLLFELGNPTLQLGDPLLGIAQFKASFDQRFFSYLQACHSGSAPIGSTSCKLFPTSTNPAKAMYRRQSIGSLQAPSLSSLPVQTLSAKITALQSVEM